ncbi:MAG: phosphate acyltransferase [Caldilineaceae bacterium]
MADPKQAALDYHKQGQPGKLKIVATKPMDTQQDLSLAYSPGVAFPVLEIANNPALAYEYTGKGNMVAVISNGSAILGLGDRGPLASKPVMEGKAVLFKRFADIDVFDIEVDSHDPQEIVRFVQMIAPTFGGVNLEDIKAPECFFIERELQRTCDIPVFHDDQHGTAIISGAGLVNAVEIVGKKMAEVTIVINGAGAAGISCAEFYVALGANKDNIIMCDSRGVIYEGRTEGMNEYKLPWAAETDLRTMEEALVGADVFIGLSVKDCMSARWCAAWPTTRLFLPWPTPIRKSPMKKPRPPAQILSLARGAVTTQIRSTMYWASPLSSAARFDVHASTINMEMKLAAARALAALTREDVPDSVLRAYGIDTLRFGPEYVIPKPLDPRVLLWVSPAVAQAGIDSGVARRELDMGTYLDQLTGRLGKSEQVMRKMESKAKQDPKRVVFAEGEHPKIIRAAYAVETQGIAKPLLLGREERILAQCRELGLSIHRW